MSKSACKAFAYHKGLSPFSHRGRLVYILYYHGTVNAQKNVLETLALTEIFNSLGTVFPKAISVQAFLRLTPKMFIMEGGRDEKCYKGSETAESLNYSNYMHLLTFPSRALLLEFFPWFSSTLSLPFQQLSKPAWLGSNPAWISCVQGSGVH